MKFGTAFLAAFLASLPWQVLPVAAQEIPFGSNVVVALPLSGCTDVNVMHRLSELLIMNDVEAAVALARREGDRCRLFEAGMKAQAERSVRRHSLVCIRPRGEPDCFWYPSNYLRTVQ